MRESKLVGMARKVLDALKAGALGDVGMAPSRLGKTDVGVLKVAMAIAALDGHVTDDELAAFERLAKKCRGFSAESAKAALREGLRTAGYIELAARALPEKELLAVFVEEIEDLLPRGFVFADPAEVRRAFVMWIAMAMSDGEYSPVERKAISLFSKSLADRQKVKLSKASSSSPAFSIAYGLGRRFDDYQAITPNFFSEAEILIARLERPEEKAAATAALKRLIQNG